MLLKAVPLFFVRYWLFCDVIPGLYIEKGWVHESIDYSYTLPVEEKHSEQEEEEEDDGEHCVPQSDSVTVRTLQLPLTCSF